MRKTRAVLTSLGALSASFAVVAAASVSAGAAGPYVVKVGTHTTGSYAYTAATTGTSPQITLKDVTSNQTLNCANGTAGGNINAGTNATGKKLASITGTNFAGCTGPAGLQLGVTQNGIWSLNGLMPVNSGGVTAGNITGISAHVAASPASQCNFDATGVVAARFANGAQTITAPGAAASLTISNVVGCFGLINNGDKASYKAVYKVTSPSGKITITNG